MAWTYHSVWAVPLLILQAAAAVRRRSGWREDQDTWAASGL